MNFKNKLALKLTVIVGLLLIILSIDLYTLSKSYFYNKYEKTLKNSSINFVDILLDSDKLDEKLIESKKKIFAIYNPKILVLAIPTTENA